MPIYQYQAFDAAGKKKSGFLEAHGEREAKLLLRDQGLLVSQLVAKAPSSSKQALKGDALLAFTLQLSQLINAGVPLYESLLTLEEQYRGESYHRVILSLSDQIKAGTKLSDAMGAFPGSFPPLYCAMIAAGESVGALGIVLERLFQLLSKQMKLQKQVVTAMIYPGILAGFSLLIIALLLGFVIPSIEEIFADRPLNGFTTFVLSLSHVLRDYWWAYIPLTVALVTYGVIKLRSPKGQLWLQRFSLKVPLVRTLVVQTALARFCRTMETMLEGGLSIVKSLQMGREVMGNVVLAQEIENAEDKIVEGSSLSLELSRSKWIPPMVSRMLAVGEDSGTTSVMLQKLADMYEEEVTKSLDRVMAMAQPVILIFMGAVIGVILLAILLPLTDISSLTN